MNPPRTCPKCQQALPADAPEGLCPACVMQNLAATRPGDPTQVRPKSALPGKPAVDIADPAEVAKRLPQFEIIELLGRGGMGVVYKARQRQLDREVALKILPLEDSVQPDFVERFRREARSLAKLNHPNIVAVHDFGESDGLYYFLMEFVDGANLRQLLQSKKLTADQALAIVPKVCDALEYAHEEGVVHRDIKPENILIDKKGRVKIADFGLAKLLRREALDMTLTLAGSTLGTLRYMAPEQVEKPEAVDHRADIYSLGVVFYEMLTGELPMGRFDPPSKKAQVDVKLDEIVLHALEKEPARRYQHASEIKTDVQRVARNPGNAPEPSMARASMPSLDHWLSGMFTTGLPGWFGKRAEWLQKLTLIALNVVMGCATMVFLGFRIQRKAEVNAAGKVIETGMIEIGQPSPWFVVNAQLGEQSIGVRWLSPSLWIGVIGVATGWLYLRLVRTRPGFDETANRLKTRWSIGIGIAALSLYALLIGFDAWRMLRSSAIKTRPPDGRPPAADVRPSHGPRPHATPRSTGQIRVEDTSPVK